MDKNEDWKFRFGIVSLLGADDPPEAFEMCKRLFEDKSEKIEIRRHAVQCIGEAKKPENQKKAVDILIEALKDNDSHLAATAANGLGRIKDKRAIGPLIEAVKWSEKHLEELLKSGWNDTRGTSDEDARLATAMRALGEMKSKDAIPVLINVMNNKIFDKQYRDEVIAFAAMALGEVGDLSALPALEKAYEDDYSSGYVIYPAIRIAIEKIKKE